ncbi:50S ribosomal protein L29 [Candidatus Wolfebacteria bacterium]|nr:50S ribosomal protein L29 [Candidatus Wolfebacteria bacterium]
MKDITKKSDKDLQKTLREKREDLRKIRFNVSKKRDPKAARNIKKDVARILTELNSRTA